jgi:hypothetical protein
VITITITTTYVWVTFRGGWHPFRTERAAFEFVAARIAEDPSLRYRVDARAE